MKKLLNTVYVTTEGAALRKDWTRRVEHVGAKPAANLGGPLIV